MKYSFPYKAHFQRSIWIYIILILVVTAGYEFAIKSKSSLKKYQKFNVFVATRKVDLDPLKEKIYNYIDNDTIKNVIVNQCNPELTSYYTMYTTFGLEDADILILNSEYIVKNDLKTHFVSFESDSSYYNDTNYIDNDVHYGLEIYHNNHGYLTNYITFDQDKSYYLFVNKNSKHLLELSSEGKTNSVINVLGGIFNEEQK